ncbi:MULTISPECIES: sensor histidine kinase [Clostridia]|uniref:sensor histidine kinase n=1 Tax=Clostridia TaxID=186801 RepID=UPI00067F6523|nr:MULTISPECIES: histidine kinase [Clostridia]
MKKLHQNSLMGKITFSYSIVFFFLIILLSIIYYFTAYHNFLQNHTRISRQLAKTISSQIDAQGSNFNNLEIRILESEDIMKYIFEEAKQHNVVSDWEFRKNLYAITGYNYEFYQMNIVNLNESTIHTFGKEYYYKPYTITRNVQENIIEPTLELDGAKIIIPPNKGCLYAPVKDVPIISVCRAFSRYPLSKKTGIIEIQVTEASLEKLINDNLYALENGGEQVLIFDNNNNPIYPSDIPQERLDYYTSLDTENKTMFRSSLFSETEIITSRYSSETMCTVMLITPASYILQNRLFYLKICFGFFLFTFVLLVFITRRLALRITAPITELKNRISSLELEQIAEEDYDNMSGDTFNELEILNKSYSRMQRRLKRSLDDVISSRTLTIQSQMLALQAQMDSHFLYNTLTIISIIAEDNDDEQAAAMCIKLTKMLRYITEDISHGTTLAQEVTHTQNYTDLITTRFGKGVEFDYQIDTALDMVRVPRLILQPIVENCVKYSRSPDRVLKISIRIWSEDGCWYANIRDNGNGFSEEALKIIRGRIADMNPEQQHPALSINGMGLVNIYLRLKLYYSSKFTFQLENKMPSDSIYGGVSITIGGILDETK